MFTQYGLGALILSFLLLTGCVTRHNEDGSQSTGINWLGIAAGMQAAGAAHNGSYSVPQQYQQVPQGSAYTSTTIIRPGRAPSYINGNDMGGSIVTPGQPTSQYSTFGNQTTIITPGKAPVYIQQP